MSWPRYIVNAGRVVRHTGGIDYESSFFIRKTGGNAIGYDSDGNIQDEDANLREVLQSCYEALPTGDPEGGAIHIGPGRFTFTEVGGLPLVIDNSYAQDSIRIVGHAPAPHSGSAATVIDVTDGDAFIEADEVAALEVGDMEIEGAAGGTCPYAIQLTETARNMDHVYLHGLHFVNFQDCLDLNNIYGSSPGNLVERCSFWPLDGSPPTYYRGVKATDISQWTFIHCAFNSQAVRSGSYGFEVLEGPLAYTERLLFIACQWNGGDVGLRFNTTGQFGMVDILGGIFEANTHGIENAAVCTGRRTVNLFGVDFVGNVTTDIKQTAGEIYVNDVGSYLTTAAKSGGVLNRLDAQSQGAEWALRDFSVGNQQTWASSLATNYNNGAVTYHPLWGLGGAGVAVGAIAQVECEVGFNGTAVLPVLEIDAAPGAGKTWQLALMKNGAATAVIATIADPDTRAAPTNVEVSFSRDDELCWRLTPAGAPAATTGRMSCVLEAGVRHG